MVGKTLGHYEILEKVGEGGMGEVYRARDTRLNRTVAIKVLRGSLSARRDLRRRFEREARTISSLNHPHICTLYDIGDQDGTSFLVMEYLEGETLEKRLRRGPLPLDQALTFAIEIAEALDRAHRQGIIHRDLRPGNIMLTKSGAKLLDFGLAKLKASPLAALTEMATESRELSEEGMIIGTLQYMSPEQLEGKETDGRADIFALGALLFEMVTGRRAFAGKSRASLIAAILAADPPPVSQLQAIAPPVLERALKRCLAKDPEERWQSARDLVAVLMWIAQNSSMAIASSPPRPDNQRASLHRRVAWALAVAFLVAAIASLAAYLHLARAPVFTTIAEIPPPEKGRFTFGGRTSGGPPALSPDGRALAFTATDASGKNVLWVRPLDSPSAQMLPGTEGAAFPFWSADSRSIGFFADDRLKTIESSGGPAVTLCDAPFGGGGSWNRQGLILYAPYIHKGLYRVAASGGIPIPVTALEEPKFILHVWPQFLPDEKHFLYVAITSDPASTGVYFASLDGKENRLVLGTEDRAVYASGFLLYSRGATLMAQAFDPERGQLKGKPHRVVEGVRGVGSYGGVFDASRNDVLAYQTGREAARQLIWFDRAGKQLGVIGGEATYYDVRLSPDGRKLASSVGSPNSDIWVDEPGRSVRTRLTFDPATDKGMPVWSPDGSRILFATLQGGKGRVGIYKKRSNGAEGDELLVPSDRPEMEVWATDWSRDGRFIIYSRGDLLSRTAEIWLLPLVGDEKPRLFLQTPVATYDGQFSPDGRWVAYTSKESGREEVYVVPFDAAGLLKSGTEPTNAASLGGKWQVSTDGGSSPRWRGDGKEIFFLAPEGTIMAAEVNARGISFHVGTPRPLFSTTPAATAAPYDVTSDGKRLVINTTPELAGAPITLMTNWTARLEDK